jgi:WD40 repeat protein
MLVLRGHTDSIRSLAYAPDGRLLATGSEDATVRLWRLPGGTAAGVLDAEEGVEVVVFAPDGKRLVAGTAGGQMLVWDPNTGKQTVRTSPHRGGVRCLSFSPDRRLLASAGWAKEACLWRTDRLPRNSFVRVGKIPGVALVAFSPDGQTLAAAIHPRGDRVTLVEDGVRLFDMPHLVGESVTLFEIPHLGGPPRTVLRPTTPVLVMAWSREGCVIATGHSTGDITLLRPQAAEAQAEVRGHGGPVYGLAFAPDGHALLSGGADGTVRVWDVTTGRQRQTYRWHGRWVTCVAVAPDGMTAAAGSDDHTAVVWDLDDS